MVNVPQQLKLGGQLHVSAAVSAGKQTGRVLDRRMVWAAQLVWGAVERRNISLAASRVSNPEYTGRPTTIYSSAPASGFGI